MAFLVTRPARAVVPCLFVWALLVSGGLGAYEFRADFRFVPPDMVYVDEKPAGPIREIVDLAVERAGHSIRWREVPWKRTHLLAKQGKTDLLVRHSMFPEREAYLATILIGYQERNVVFVLAPDKEVKLESFEDLQNLVIGEQRGYFYAPDYQKSDKIRKVIADSSEQLASLLRNGRIDAAVMSTDLKGDLEMLLDIKGAKLAPYSMTFLNARYCSIPKKSPAMAHFDELNAAFYAMRKSGEITDIMKKHGAKAFIQDFTTPESKAQEAASTTVSEP